MPLRLSNSTIDADDTTLSLSANWNDITSLTHSLMYFRRKTKALLVITQKGYSRSLMWKKQTYNCALTIQDLEI